MGFGQVDNIDIVTDAGLIGRIVVVAENLQLLTNTHSRLGYERYQVHGHTIRQFANQCSRMSTNGVEVAQDNALDGGTRVDVILNDFLVDLLCIAIGRHCLLDGSILGNRQVLL